MNSFLFALVLHSGTVHCSTFPSTSINFFNLVASGVSPFITWPPHFLSGISINLFANCRALLLSSDIAGCSPPHFDECCFWWWLEHIGYPSCWFVDQFLDVHSNIVGLGVPMVGEDNLKSKAVMVTEMVAAVRLIIRWKYWECAILYWMTMRMRLGWTSMCVCVCNQIYCP